ncbi:MAG TPA: PQQ-dependent sugar dehydrogenase, partial [Candidatus Sulfomarinibacteraceae bacterium]|nr:PQQ-dependent sugar dehydrogenase [Candidatus Sulfomarinibacteraceae bacterium]
MRNDCSRVLRRTSSKVAFLIAMASLPGPALAGVPVPPDLVLDTVATGLASPVVVTHAGDGSGRLFIVEKAGRIRIVDSGTLLPTPFLDIDPEVNSTGFEQGLLGLAFDPDSATNGDFYVYYTRADNATVLAHYNASPPSSNVAGTAGSVLWTQPQPAANHNVGQLGF